ncbi:MAG: LacI family transcriptional regulator [Hoeflea sp.]|uniref:LacI family DNA-binding transcriptional regulator n=1 Tax=Hoeflea sp. TaxID=1940281 RepID=UPI000C10A0E7|nr:LacI family DNA-binding transcriptional regulator [Hoeflea sp.]PHR23244.1 MAG: LacI family transcriptional regulator [Hoeflea sp.]
MSDFAKPTLDDVARAAGVSTATVSRCLNAPDRVIAPTRERVMKAVEALGYTPDFGGRALASRRTNTVGAIIPTMDNAIFARGLQSFQEALSKFGKTLLVASSGYSPAREREQMEVMAGRGVDGMLLIGSARPDSSVDFLRRRGIPFLGAWNLGDAEGYFVGFDNHAAAAELTQMVLDKGHRRLAMIAGISQMNDRAADRMEGVRATAERAGIARAQLPVIEAAYTFDDGARAFGELMALSPRPTAVMCGNDVLAVGAMQKARELGLGVPEDVSITGFDDIDLASVVAPKLTTIRVPHRRMGEAAAEMLIKLINKQPVERQIEIPTAIVERDTLGPPPVDHSA